MADVSSNRLYLGNLPQNATKADIETHFANHGSGEIVETKLMNGFGFVEYRDGNDARDAVPQLNGSEFMGNRLVVQFARGGNRPRDMPAYERPVPRTRRTVYRLKLSGLPPETSWQDLKDFARQDGLDVVYSEVSRERDGSGFVEYETEDDLKTAVDKIDARDFKGQPVTAVAEIQPERPRDRFRSRSPPPYRRGGGGYYNNGPPGGYDDYRDRRGPPPRGYSPRGDRGGYRERSPGPRGGRDYHARDRYDRSPPPPPRSRGPPVDDYPPPRGRYADDGYPPRGGGGGGGYGGGRSGYGGGAGGDDAAYGNGHRGSYEGRAPASPPRRQRSPGGRAGYEAGGSGGGGGGGYDRRAY